MGQEDAFPRPRLSACCGFGEGTFAGTRDNGQDAPIAGHCVPAITDGLANPSRSFLHSRALASGTNILYTFSHAVMPRLYRRRTECVGRFPDPTRHLALDRREKGNYAC